ncbi:10220_t:CDS:2, partial [Cetraspora pellucida]
ISRFGGDTEQTHHGITRYWLEIVIDFENKRKIDAYVKNFEKIDMKKERSQKKSTSTS